MWISMKHFSFFFWDSVAVVVEWWRDPSVGNLR
jgi:hypothetical protein